MKVVIVVIWKWNQDDHSEYDIHYITDNHDLVIAIIWQTTVMIMAIMIAVITVMIDEEQCCLLREWCLKWYWLEWLQWSSRWSHWWRHWSILIMMIPLIATITTLNNNDHIISVAVGSWNTSFVKSPKLPSSIATCQAFSVWSKCHSDTSSNQQPSVLFSWSLGHCSVQHPNIGRNHIWHPILRTGEIWC